LWQLHLKLNHASLPQKCTGSISAGDRSPKDNLKPLRLADLWRKNILPKRYFGKLAQVISKNNHNNGAALASMISHKMLIWETIT
jgi:hypothetical protein